MTTQSQNIDNLIAHIVFECNAVDVDSLYDDMLDECFSFESVGGIFAHMLPSRVLKECDEIAYRCGKNGWLDGESDRIIEIDDNYYDVSEVDDAKATFIADMEAEASELEEEIEELEAEEFEGDEENNDAEVMELQAKLAAIHAQVAEVENHSF